MASWKQLTQPQRRALAVAIAKGEIDDMGNRGRSVSVLNRLGLVQIKRRGMFVSDYKPTDEGRKLIAERNARVAETEN